MITTNKQMHVYYNLAICNPNPRAFGEVLYEYDSGTVFIVHHPIPCGIRRDAASFRLKTSSTAAADEALN